MSLKVYLRKNYPDPNPLQMKVFNEYISGETVPDISIKLNVSEAYVKLLVSYPKHPDLIAGVETALDLIKSGYTRDEIIAFLCKNKFLKYAAVKYIINTIRFYDLKQKCRQVRSLKFTRVTKNKEIKEKMQMISNLCARGFSYVDIAKMIGVSAQTVSAFARRCNIKSRYSRHHGGYAKSLESEIYRMNMQGMSTKRISNELGLTVSKVRRLLYAYKKTLRV